MGVAIQLGGDTGKPRIELIAALNETLTCWDLRAERLALRPIRIAVDRVWPVTKVVRDRAHLCVWVREAIG